MTTLSRPLNSCYLVDDPHVAAIVTLAIKQLLQAPADQQRRGGMGA
jgi:hypothetical protein